MSDTTDGGDKKRFGRNSKPGGGARGGKGGPRGEAPRGPGGTKPRFGGGATKSGGGKPFRARREDGGEAKPEGGERKRSFRPKPAFGEKRDRPERSERAERPERRERPERSGSREGGEERPRRSFSDRPPRERGEGGAGGGAKPFRPFKRREEGAEGGGQGERPAFRPKSRGMHSHASAERGEGGPKRSYGRRSHDGAEGTGEERPRRAKPLSSERGERSERPKRFDGEGGDRPKRFDRSEGGERPRRFDKDGGDRPKRAPRGDRAEGGFERRPRREAADEGASADGTMRIARRLARAGISSRRDAEAMIADGRVTLNGQVLTSPAVDVSMTDRIEVDGAPLPTIERTRLWLFHKPAGLVTTNRDPEGRPTVFDALPEEMPRVLSVGRLDINTEGLLLLTNDGGLARVLELPSTGWLRRYRVRAHGDVDQSKLDDLRQGIAIDGVFYGAVEANLDRKQGSNIWMTLGLREGKNREVKRILGHLGLEVNRLIRLSFGPFQLGELEEGAVQEINGRTLRDQLGPTLIEEAGADFEAGIVNPFSNKPVRAGRPEREERAERPAPGERAKPRGEWVSSAAEKPKGFKKSRQAFREEGLDRLDTRPPRPPRDRDEKGGERPSRGGFKPRGDRPERGERSESGFKPKRFGGARSEEGGTEAGKRPRAPAGAPKRSANVWMASGARPQGKSSAKADGGRPGGRGGAGPKGGSRPPRDRG